MAKLKPWTLKQLWAARFDGIEQCQSESERDTFKAMNRLEIKELAIKIQLTRKLTPGEQSILDSLHTY